MPKDKKKNKEEKIQNLLEQLKEMEIQSEEIEELEKMLKKMLEEKTSKWKQFLNFIRMFLINFVVFYVIILLVSGFFLNHFVISKFSVFYIGAILSFIFCLLELFPRYLQGRGFLYQFVILGSIIALTYSFNSLFPIYDKSYIWLIVYMGIIIVYILVLVYMFRKVRRIFYE